VLALEKYELIAYLRLDIAPPALAILRCLISCELGMFGGLNQSRGRGYHHQVVQATGLAVGFTELSGFMIRAGLF
jgi:hypothetical protein